MKGSFNLLIRFIDLGLLLLMAFLALADLSTPFQSPLPGAQGGSSSEEQTWFRLSFGGDMAVTVRRHPSGAVVCQPSTPARLVSCLSPISGEENVVMIDPEETVTMQQYVAVQDACQEAEAQCVLEQWD